MLAILQLCALLYFQPIMAQYIFDFMLDYKEKNNLDWKRIYIYTGFFQCWCIYLPSQILYAFLYYIEWGFLERYKAHDE